MNVKLLNITMEPLVQVLVSIGQVVGVDGGEADGFIMAHEAGDLDTLAVLFRLENIKQ